MNLLFLHGFPFNSSSWQAQKEYFGAKYRVFTPDLRGMGAGPEDNPPWFIHQYVEDVKELLNREGVERAVLCGLSMGGYIALHFAQKYPERLRALVLCDTQAGADSNEAKDKRFANVQKVYAGLPAFAEEFSRNVLAKGALVNRPELQRRVVEMITGNKASSVAQVLATLASRRDSTPFLGEIQAPTLVIVGEEDVVTPLAAARVLAERIPGARLEVIAGAGHMSNLEQPEAFNHALESFLDLV
jgi:pimeloyl-ACP methyl ester carboxylesterase